MSATKKPEAPAPTTGADPHALDTERLLAGDRAEFERMVAQESPRLFRVIVRMLGDEDEARSILQETFLQAYQRLDTFRGDSKFTTWLYAIGINLARGELRKSKRLSSLDEKDVERMQPTFDRGMFAERVEPWSPHRLAELHDRRRIVHDAIDRLPADYRTVVTLRDIQEYPTKDVAEMLGISRGAVRVRLHRARQALRSMLDGHFRQ
jgi:RNA polymerase sigma-70 factor (ECF subfamily)